MNIKDLQFKPHSADPSGTMAEVFFPNGYGASVITGGLFYTTPKAPYEVAVLKGTEGNRSLTYDTPITNDVLGYQTESDVNAILKDIEAL